MMTRTKSQQLAAKQAKAKQNANQTAKPDPTLSDQVNKPGVTLSNPATLNPNTTASRQINSEPNPTVSDSDSNSNLKTYSQHAASPRPATKKPARTDGFCTTLIVEDDDSIWTLDGGSTGKESEFEKIASISQFPVRAPKRKRKSKRYSEIEKKIRMEYEKKYGHLVENSATSEGMEEGEISDQTERKPHAWEKLAASQPSSRSKSNSEPQPTQEPTQKPGCSSNLPHVEPKILPQPTQKPGPSTNLPHQKPGSSTNLPQPQPPTTHQPGTSTNLPSEPQSQLGTSTNLPPRDPATMVIDELDVNGQRSKARRDLKTQIRAGQNPFGALSSDGSYTFSTSSGQIEEGVYKNMILKEMWILKMRQGAHVESAGTHTLSFRNIEIMVNGKLEVIESPKVAEKKGLTVRDIWRAFTARLDRDVLMKKFENVSKNGPNAYLRAT